MAKVLGTFERYEVNKRAYVESFAIIVVLHNVAPAEYEKLSTVPSGLIR
jgi:hypothetical protein